MHLINRWMRDWFNRLNKSAQLWTGLCLVLYWMAFSSEVITSHRYADLVGRPMKNCWWKKEPVQYRPNGMAKMLWGTNNRSPFGFRGREESEKCVCVRCVHCVRSGIETHTVYCVYIDLSLSLSVLLSCSFFPWNTHQRSSTPQIFSSFFFFSLLYRWVMCAG